MLITDQITKCFVKWETWSISKGDYYGSTNAQKSTQWAMKAQVMADSTNGYVYNWKLYTGKDNSNSARKGLVHGVALELVQDLVGFDYQVCVDNFIHCHLFTLIWSNLDSKSAELSTLTTSDLVNPSKIMNCQKERDTCEWTDNNTTMCLVVCQKG